MDEWKRRFKMRAISKAIGAGQGVHLTLSNLNRKIDMSEIRERSRVGN